MTPQHVPFNIAIDTADRIARRSKTRLRVFKAGDGRGWLIASTRTLPVAPEPGERTWIVDPAPAHLVPHIIQAIREDRP